MLEASGWKNEDALQGKFSMVLLLPERQKLQALADFAHAFDLLEDNGILLVGLHNDWGAKRFEKQLAEVAGKQGTLSKFHCRAFWARKTGNLNNALLEEWKTQGDWQKVVEGRFWSRPGLFSWEKIDGGSRYLTENLRQDCTVAWRIWDLAGVFFPTSFCGNFRLFKGLISSRPIG